MSLSTVKQAAGGGGALTRRRTPGALELAMSVGQGRALPAEFALLFAEAKTFTALGASIGLQCVCVVGGVDMMAQAIALARKPLRLYAFGCLSRNLFSSSSLLCRRTRGKHGLALLD